MRYYLLFTFTAFLFLFNASTSHAQKIKYEDDTIKIDAKPYAVLQKKNVAMLRNDYILKSMTGIELIYFKSVLRTWTGRGFRYSDYDELYYEANFMQSGGRADIKHYNANGFAKMIVENNFIKDNQIDPESEKRFIRLNNGYLPSTEPTTQEAAAPAPAVVVNINNNAGTPSDVVSSNEPEQKANAVKSKSKSPVIISGNKILRDDNVIGKFRQDTTSSNYTQKSIILTIYNDGGEKIAEASAPLAKPEEWSIKILAENKTYNILYDSPTKRESLFKWLADKNYLTY